MIVRPEAKESMDECTWNPAWTHPEPHPGQAESPPRHTEGPQSRCAVFYGSVGVEAHIPLGTSKPLFYHPSVLTKPPYSILKEQNLA